MTDLAPAINSAFSTGLPGFQFAWDSVSRGAALKCWRYYQYTIIEGWQPKRMDGFPPEAEVHLTFGIWMHEGREHYYRSRTRGEDHEMALDGALNYILCATWNKKLGRGWASDEPTKNRKTLVQTLVWYLDAWRDDPLETVILANGQPAVELSFRIDSGLRVANEAILLCGHIDRQVTFGGNPYVSDLKTTKSDLGTWYFDTFKPDDQLTGYHFASQIGVGAPSKGIILDAIQVGVTFSRFQRAPITYTKEELEEWYRDFSVLVSTAEQHASEQYWPKNTKSCYRCEFRGVCSKSPSVRPGLLSAQFTRRTWDPLVARGDI